MADTAARLALIARRYEVYRFTIVVTGIDLTGVTMNMQVRLQRGTPGAPLFSLATVTTAAAEGLKLDSVVTINGVTTSIIKGRVNQTTMNDATKVPFAGELGADTVLAYAIQWTLNGDANTRIEGEFIARDSAYGSDNAPANRPADYGSAQRLASGGTGSLTFGDQVIYVSIDGADVLAPMAASAAAAVSQAQTAAQAALSSQQSAAAAVAGVAGFAAGTLNSTLTFDPSVSALNGDGTGNGGGSTLVEPITFASAGMSGTGMLDQFTVYCEQAIPNAKFKVLRANANGTFTWVADVVKSFPKGITTYTAPADFTAIPVTSDCVIAVYQPTTGYSTRDGAGAYTTGTGVYFDGDFTGTNGTVKRSALQWMMKARVQFDLRTEQVGQLNAIVGNPAVVTRGHPIVNGGSLSTTSIRSWVIVAPEAGYLQAVNAWIAQAGRLSIVVLNPAGVAVYLQDVVATVTGPNRFVLPKQLPFPAGSRIGLNQQSGKIAFTDGVGTDVTAGMGRPGIGSSPALSSLTLTMALNYEAIAVPAVPLAQAPTGSVAATASALVPADFDTIQAWKTRVEGALSRGERAIVAIVGDSQFGFGNGRSGVPFTLRMRRKYGDGGPGWVSYYSAALPRDTGSYTQGETEVGYDGSGWAATAATLTPDAPNQQKYTTSTAGDSVYVNYYGSATLTTLEYHHAGGGGTVSWVINGGAPQQFTLSSGPGKIVLPAPPATPLNPSPGLQWYARMTVVSGTVSHTGFNMMAAKGLVVHNIAVGATAAQQWAALDQTRWKAALVNLGFHAMIFSLGGNDELASRTTDQFVADMKTLIGTVRSIDPGNDVIVSIRPQTDRSGIALRMADYATAMRALTATTRFAMYDAAKRFGAAPSEYNYTGTKFVALQSDNLHLNQLGRDLYVSGLCELLGAN